MTAPHDQLNRILINSDGVPDAFPILDDRKSPGGDINPYILRSCSGALFPPLTPHPSVLTQTFVSFGANALKSA